MSKTLKNSTPYTEQLVYAFIVLAIGIEIGFLIFLILVEYFPNRLASISLEIDLSGVLSIFITVFLTLYVLRKIARRDSLKNRQIEFLIGFIEKWESDFSDYLKKITSDETGPIHSDVVMQIKVSRMAFDKFTKLYREEELLMDSCPTPANIRKNLATIHELLTLTPRSGEQNNGLVTVEDGVLKIPSSIIYKLQRLITDNKMEVYSLIMHINVNGNP